jgi:hypothetical protein
MRTFTFDIQDDRRQQAARVSAIAADEDRARVLAKSQLNESPHHLSVHVREARKLLFVVRRDGADSELLN